MGSVVVLSHLSWSILVLEAYYHCHGIIIKYVYGTSSPYYVCHVYYLYTIKIYNYSLEKNSE